ncbi:uncharacterized protein LOC132934031 [Metopolophium dirhodum]|uniref:uncharacterized protein LOC132933824 n=1 Tax=Metopolophium dirhodum TaxID=44670 RepID=UPI00298FE7BD|nr:uncharacterized protein LOC132933824 [Metopolophium dirhodum]XP_060856296.1 uncharacterized protein LOC132934031 [Metopolophium dirhodum]
MKAIYSMFFYISLAIALCPSNVSTFCGNDEQIEDLKTALIIHETSYTVMTTLSAIPITGAALTFVHVMSAGQFALRLNEAFDEMENSLNKNHINYSQCLEILEKTETANTVIKSTGLGFSLASMIPGVGLALLPPRIAASISAMFLIRDGLAFWQKTGCQYATTRDCYL